jgi:N-methylhydantoinase B/oxoprolinase/acetone carboxylase alpha subunit
MKQKAGLSNKTSEGDEMEKEKLDLVNFEVFFNKLDGAVNEGREVLKYLSGSVIVKEAGEALEAFYLPDGSAVDIACGILMHFMNVTRCIRYMEAERYAEEGIGIYDGDQFVNNEAYVAGMHCPDTVVIAPVFYKGKLEGYVAAISHTTETGGIEPGGMCPSATEAWHDGFHVPAVKLVERGVTRRDVWNMLLRSTRDPRTLELDLRARIAANERTRKRILELIEEFGIDFFRRACKHLVEEGNEFFKAKVGLLRPGVYKSRVYCDTLGGIQPPKLAVIETRMEITPDNRMIVGVPVVSPQQPCYNNAYLPAVEASLYYALLTQVVFDGRWNSGMSASIQIEDIPERSRLNADASQSVGYATIGIAMNFCAAVTECLSRAYYAAGIEEEVQAMPAGNINDTVNAGVDEDGRNFANILLSIGLGLGGGGRVGSDGLSNYHFYNPWQEVPDTESEEMLTRTLHLCRGFLHWILGGLESGGGDQRAARLPQYTGSKRHFHPQKVPVPESRLIRVYLAAIPEISLLLVTWSTQTFMI